MDGCNPFDWEAVLKLKISRDCTKLCAVSTYFRNVDRNISVPSSFVIYECTTNILTKILLHHILALVNQ